MFSFHKPRVYRSTEGCCICRAKSSSSRFTDSSKYEDDSMKCFNLDYPRQGEICNACVLLVKRFKRLPAGSNRHWGHVVDARVGPGIKSMTKFKKLKEENGKTSSIPEKFSKIFKKKKPITSKDSKAGLWEHQARLPPTPDSLESDGEQDINTYKMERRLFQNKSSSRRKSNFPRKLSKVVDTASFVDETEWKAVKSCCGIIYESVHSSAALIDSELFKLCNEHKPPPTAPQVVIIPTPVLKKHHLFFKRQSESFPSGDIHVNTEKTDLKQNMAAPTQNAVISITKVQHTVPIESKQKSFLHKIKADTGKIVKHSLDKLGALKMKPADIVEVKNLVKPVEKPFVRKTTVGELNITLVNKKRDIKETIPAVVSTNKFNDNSSDSGFDENLIDRKSASPSQEEQEKKCITRPVQTMFLTSNGIQVQGQQSNLLLNGTEVTAKIFNTRKVQQPIRNSSKNHNAQGAIANSGASSSSGSHPVRAILNKPTDSCSGSAPIVTLTTVPTMAQLSNCKATSTTSTSAPSLNKKLIVIKTKYNNNNNNSNYSTSRYHQLQQKEPQKPKSLPID